MIYYTLVCVLGNVVLDCRILISRCLLEISILPFLYVFSCYFTWEDLYELSVLALRRSQNDVDIVVICE